MKIRARAVAVVVVSLLGGCGPDYGGLEVQPEGTVLPGDSADSSQFRIAVGHALRFHARPRSHSSASFEDAHAVELRPANPDLARVFRDPDDWHWVVVGRAFGRTCVEVVVGGKVEACIDAFIRSETG